MSSEAEAFLLTAVRAAHAAAHPFPAMAACEAALESAWGLSRLAREANNLFGEKASQHAPANQVLELPTREFLNHVWTFVGARWRRYATMADCFADRKATLERLAGTYPHYAAALKATAPEAYIAEVSKTWSTDPNRAASVLKVYRQYAALLAPYL